MNGVVISRAGPDRLDVLEPLWKAMHSHHRSVAPHLEEIAPIRSDDDSWARRRLHYQRVLNDPDTFAFLAERDGRAVGYAVVKITGTESTLAVGDRVAELDSLSVLPEERGNGLGGALMDAVDDELRRRGIREISLAVMEGNHGAAHFYERRGFIPYLRFMLAQVPRHSQVLPRVVARKAGSSSATTARRRRTGRRLRRSTRGRRRSWRRRPTRRCRAAARPSS